LYQKVATAKWRWPGWLRKVWSYQHLVGAVFIDSNSSNQSIALQRDKTIPILVDRLGGLGVMGSDAWLTQTKGLRARLASTSLFTLNGVRFALCAPQNRAQAVEEKLQAGQPLRVVAAYRELARQALGPGTQVLRVADGGLEALPRLFPGLDGTFDLVETGETAADNGLVIVRDNLVPVTLDAVWPAAPGNLLQSN
jgi:ATP phosphoribosyltransferase